MKTPVCEQCIRAGSLCPRCNQKLAEGKISELDFEVAQILYQINERINISNASFYKALDLGHVIFILTQGEVGVLIGKQGKVVSELSSSLGKKVRIAEVQGDMKKTISDMIMPARLLGINDVFHDGKVVSKIRISRQDLPQLPIDLMTLETALSRLMERQVSVVLE